MRRALGSLLVSFSLVFATISWSGFIMTRTIFDPGRSERLADELFENEEVRAVAIDRLSETINSSIPPEISITDEQLEDAAELVLEDPRVEALVKEQLVLAHQNALNGVDEPVQVDATVIGQAGRDAAVAQQPSLDAVLPAVPPVEIALPTTGLSWLGTVNTYVRRITLFSGLLAVAGIAVSLFISSNRPRVLRRVSYWALGAAAFWIVAAFVAPWVVNLISPSSMILVTAAISVFFGAMIPPAIAMAVFGAVLFGISSFLPRASKQRAAGRVQSNPQRRGSTAGYDDQGRRPQQRRRPPSGNNNEHARSQQQHPQQQHPQQHGQPPASYDDRYGRPQQQPSQQRSQDAQFDNQRLQRQVEASRANNEQESFGYTSDEPSSSGSDDDWFDLPAEHRKSTARPTKDLWEDDPTIRQQRF